jgi:hypothetical protein
MKAAAATIGIFFIALSWTDANANIITENDIDGSIPADIVTYTAGKIDDPNITASGISRGSGLTASSGTDRFNSKSWSTGTIDTSDYYTFTLDANDGYELNFTSFDYTGAASASGPKAFELRSSLDGFTTNIGSPTASGTTIDLTAAEFQHITDPIEFRLYGYSATSGSGTFSINDYTFNGTVEAVPEPNTMALLGIGSLLMLASRHRTRKSSGMAA